MIEMQRSIRKTAALLLTLVLLVSGLVFPAEAAKTYTGTVTKDRIFFRARPTTSGGYIGRVNKGDKLEIMSISGDFYYVRFNGRKGYVMCKFVDVPAKSVTALKKAAKPTATPKPKVTPTPKKTATPKPRVKATPKKTATPKPKVTPTPKKKATPTPKATPKPTYKTQSLKWFNTGKNLFKRNTTFTIKDVKTGKTWNCKVMYGTNHLDAEPLTRDDTKKMTAAYGGKINYKRRAVLVLYKGHVYAASIYGEPHGDQTIKDNGFNGQFCLHFTGSKTHGSDKVDADHQAAIQVALKATW